jgi:hypothetical protein
MIKRLFTERLLNSGKVMMKKMMKDGSIRA